MTLERKKRYFVNHIQDEPMARLCRILRIDRKTGCNWRARFEQGGLEELIKDDPGGRPKKAVPDLVRQTVLEVRKKRG